MVEAHQKNERSLLINNVFNKKINSNELSKLKDLNSNEDMYEEVVQMIEEQAKSISQRLTSNFEQIVLDCKQFLDSVSLIEASMEGKIDESKEPIMRRAVKIMMDQVIHKFDAEELFAQHCYTMIVTGDHLKKQELLKDMAKVVRVLGLQSPVLNRIEKKIAQTFTFEYEHRFNEFKLEYFQIVNEW
jgi:hypothetical protein